MPKLEWLDLAGRRKIAPSSSASGAEEADRYLVDDDTVAFGERTLQVRATPGHIGGCLTYVLDDRSMAFTGDCLMIRGSGRTDFHQGDPGAMFRSVREQIFSLPDSCLLYPAHDYRGLTVTSVGEERRFNPRLGGEAGEGDFTGYMKNLRLAHPKKMDVAVPANLKCGRPETDLVASEDPTWAPLKYSFAGIWEIDPHGLEEHSDKVQILDVREPREFEGPLGHIRGARQPQMRPARNRPCCDRGPTWAPLKYSFAGIWEIDPHGLEEHADKVQILDVREPREFEGPLGHIRGSQLIPLAASWRATGRSLRYAAPAAARPKPP